MVVKAPEITGESSFYLLKLPFWAIPRWQRNTHIYAKKIEDNN
jgi:hypothetical protein